MNLRHTKMVPFLGHPVVLGGLTLYHPIATFLCCRPLIYVPKIVKLVASRQSIGNEKWMQFFGPPCKARLCRPS